MFTAEPGEGERWHWSVAILVSLLSVHCGTWGRGEVALKCRSRACLVFTAEPGEGERWHWSVAILASLLSVHCGTGGRGEVALECCDTREPA